MRRPPLVFLSVWLVVLGCGRSTEPTRAEAPPKAAASDTAPRPAASVEGDRALRFPAATRVVAVGDLHGDLGSTREAFRLAGAIDADDHWIGGTMTLVQTGDQLDRGDDEPEILDLLERLEKEAEKAGGRLVVLNGNHEIMNVEGDMRYVTPEGFTDFGQKKGDRPDPSVRVAAFAPGKPLAKRLARRPVVAIVGDTVFAHGGVLPEHVTYGLDRMNDETSRWMRGEAPSPPRAVTREDSPVWTRAYGGDVDDATCRTLSRVLESLRAKRMVVGHTVQKRMNSACEGKVFRIDVGLSDYYGKELRTEVLEITGGDARPLRK